MRGQLLTLTSGFIARGDTRSLSFVALTTRWPETTSSRTKHRPGLRVPSSAIAAAPSCWVPNSRRSFARAELFEKGKKGLHPGYPNTPWALSVGKKGVPAPCYRRATLSCALRRGGYRPPLGLNICKLTRPYLTTIQRPRLDLKVALSNSKRSLCFSHALPLARALVPP